MIFASGIEFCARISSIGFIFFHFSQIKVEFLMSECQVGVGVGIGVWGLGFGWGQGWGLSHIYKSSSACFLFRCWVSG